MAKRGLITPPMAWMGGASIPFWINSAHPDYDPDFAPAPRDLLGINIYMVVTLQNLGNINQTGTLEYVARPFSQEPAWAGQYGRTPGYTPTYYVIYENQRKSNSAYPFFTMTFPNSGTTSASHSRIEWTLTPRGTPGATKRIFAGVYFQSFFEMINYAATPASASFPTQPGHTGYGVNFDPRLRIQVNEDLGAVSAVANIALDRIACSTAPYVFQGMTLWDGVSLPAAPPSGALNAKLCGAKHLENYATHISNTWRPF